MLIAIGHQKRNGKSEVASLLSAFFRIPVRPYAMPIKKAYSDLTGLSLEDIEALKGSPELPPGVDYPVLKGLLDLSTFVMNHVPVRYFERHLDFGSQVIDDWRYLESARQVADRGGVNILVVRPGMENNDISGSVHLSERELTQSRLLLRYAFPRGGATGDPLIHYLLLNDGTVDDLRRKVTHDLIPFLQCHFLANHLGFQ